ncbi:VRR-NUC domain-containing protein [Treponema lecithinolyticum]
MNVKNTLPESEVVREVKEVIRITGLKLQRINTGCFAIGEGRAKRFIKTAEAGTLDFEGYDNHGRHVGIECKRPVGGRLSDAQAERIADINRKGGIAFVVTNGNEALELLRKNKCI